MNFWLMKSEPETYSLAHLKKDKSTWWEGVRNYQARNFMSQSMKVGDRVLFYHSNAMPPGVAGLARVARAAMPDKTQFDSESEYYEPRASLEKPIWYCVQLTFQTVFPTFVPLAQLKEDAALSELLVIKKGQRLSIQPVQPAEYDRICQLGGMEPAR